MILVTASLLSTYSMFYMRGPALRWVMLLVSMLWMLNAWTYGSWEQVAATPPPPLPRFMRRGAQAAHPRPDLNPRSTPISRGACCRGRGRDRDRDRDRHGDHCACPSRACGHGPSRVFVLVTLAYPAVTHEVHRLPQAA